MTSRILTVALLALVSTACASDDESSAGSGTASFTTYGEDFIEEGIPAAEVEDGWDISFDRFLLVLGPVTVNDSQQGEGATLAGTTLFDLTEAGPHDVGTTEELTAGNWDEVGFDVGPIDSETTRDASAESTEQALMSDEGFSVYAEGSATKDGVTKTFRWGFSHTTNYRECTEVDNSGDDVRQGIQVTNGGETDVQLTIHGDHFFYDDLTAENAVLRFDPIAMADDEGDPDGEVTLAELHAVQLVDVPAGSYGTGSYSDVNTLGDFVVALTSTLGHFQGEGHCHSHQE